MNNYSVRIMDLCFSYESKMILKHISMDISSNSICFIMGDNGSGKTTLLKNIMGFLTPRKGAVQLFGENVSGIDKQVMSRLMSYVPQAIHLNTDFSVIDYISMGRTPYIGAFSKMTAEDYQIIENTSIMLGINEFYDMPFNKLSGGQKQMVAISRSIIQSTPVIIMDEPMSALDIGKQLELLKVLQNLARDGKTIIISTHNPNHAMVLESVACFLKRGEIAGFGKSSEIICNELLQQIYGSNIMLDHGEKTDAVVFNKELIQ